MIAELQDRQPEVVALCLRYGVRRLEVFGSAASSSSFDPNTSDLDLLVEFQQPHKLGSADQYFGLLNDLHQIFGREIGLVSVRSLRNPYFIRSISRSRQVLYAWI